jgi:hypothetical protein
MLSNADRGSGRSAVVLRPVGLDAIAVVTEGPVARTWVQHADAEPRKVPSQTKARAERPWPDAPPSATPKHNELQANACLTRSGLGRGSPVAQKNKAKRRTQRRLRQAASWQDLLSCPIDSKAP